MNQFKRHEIFSRLQAANPHPTTELEFDGAFQLLIAVLLSAQTTDVAVNKVTKVLYALAPTPQAMLELGEEKVRDTIKTIGLYRTKAAHVIATCSALLNSLAVKCHKHERNWKACREWGAKPPMWC